MKDYNMRYPDYDSSYEKLRNAMKEAWDAVGAKDLLAHCTRDARTLQAVIDAQRRHTKY
jgi:hypothetical protein